MGMMFLIIPITGVAALVGSKRRRRRAITQASVKTQNPAARVQSAQSQASRGANRGSSNIASDYRELKYQASEANSTQTQDIPSEIGFERVI